jgi:CheY-like chemotaxis protein
MTKQREILVIDDDPTFLNLTQVALERHGYRVETAISGAEGLSKMGERRPDLVILDVMMEWVLEGVNLSRQMLREPELWSIPIIMCTSIRSSEYKEFFPQDEYLHVDSWLDKPCSPNMLVSEVESSLARYDRFRSALHDPRHRQDDDADEPSLAVD